MQSPDPSPPSSSPPAPPRDGRRRALARLRLVIVLALLLPLAAFVAVAGYLYHAQFADARLRLDRTSRIAQEQALKLFETNESLLERMLDLLGDADDATLLANGAVVHDRLRRMTAALPQVQGLFVNGADGRMLASSRVYPPARALDYSDREWFVAHRSGRVPLFVSEQLVSRATGEPFFDMSRRRAHTDGTFAGTVNVSLRPGYLTDFYRELAASERGLRMAVLRDDGRLIARWPEPLVPNAAIPAADPLMQQIAAGRASGESRGPSPFDGVELLRTYRRLAHYPVYVVAAVDVDTLRTAWLERSTLLALFVFPTAAGFAAMAWTALRRARREIEAAERLDDETARRQRIELALLQSQKLEALGRLTGGVAHDFNNLLMVVSSNLFLHKRLRPETAASGELAAIERAVGSGAKLTRQLLAFARAQALVKEPISLQQRLPVLLDLLRPLLGASIELRCDIAPDTGTIEVDPAEFELALLNLAVNARDAMRGKGVLAIRAMNAAAPPPDLDGDFVLIEVADTGPGFAPGAAEHAFEPFFTTKPLGQGTGLGLSQVWALCHSAGGLARIGPGPEGSGATLQLFLQRHDEPGTTAAARTPVPRSLHCRLLLVEDNDAVAAATSRLLEALGCTVQRVAGARSALAAIDFSVPPPEVVLSDIEMPGDMDGIALATQLRQRDPPVPVVLMTGYALRLEQAAREDLEVLPKPCAPELLADAIERALVRGREAAADSTAGGAA